MNRTSAVLATVCLALGSVACSQEKRVAAESEPAVVEAAPDPSVVQVPKSDQFPMVEVTTRRLADELNANGSVAPDVSRTVPVNALTGGRVLEVFARLGDDVTKGQPLLKLQSSDLAQAIADYRKFQADELLASRSLERAKALYDRGALAEKDLQAADDAEVKAKVDVESAEQRIKILGGDLKELSPVITIYSPATGTIVEQNITNGAAAKSLDNSPNLFTIADLSRIWVLCDVYENNLGQVKVGDIASVSLNAYPGKSFQARVQNVGRLLDPATRTAKVRLELDNHGGLFRPGMFAVATFRSQTARTVPVIPVKALLRLHDRDWVFKPIGPNSYRRTEVQTGPAFADGTQQIVAGLKPGDQVVAQALQFESSVEQ
jgi:cobalt-zinc-cadmium efflux system membrane fusion protein